MLSIIVVHLDRDFLCLENIMYSVMGFFVYLYCQDASTDINTFCGRARLHQWLLGCVN